MLSLCYLKEKGRGSGMVLFTFVKMILSISHIFQFIFYFLRWLTGLAFPRWSLKEKETLNKGRHVPSGGKWPCLMVTLTWDGALIGESFQYENTIICNVLPYEMWFTHTHYMNPHCIISKLFSITSPTILRGVFIPKKKKIAFVRLASNFCELFVCLDEKN